MNIRVGVSPVAGVGVAAIGAEVGFGVADRTGVGFGAGSGVTGVAVGAGSPMRCSSATACSGENSRQLAVTDRPKTTLQ
jgi:hypothetical protein